MKNILHSIKAYLYKNAFDKESNNYTARVITERSLDVKAVCQSAASRGKVDISASAMQHAVELFLKEMEYRLCDGYSINTGSFTAVPSVKGVFDNPAETFDPGKHTLSFQFNQGESLQKKIPDVNVRIMGVAGEAIRILTVTDLKSGSVNKYITPKYMLRIDGRMLKLAGEHPEVGIRLINIETGLRTEIEQQDIALNYPTKLMIMLPALAQGCYLLEITSQYTTSGILKKPNTATFEHQLYVT